MKKILILTACVFSLLSCEKDRDNEEHMEASDRTSLSTETKQTYANSFKYGQHFPNGKAAVDYIYSNEGMWKPIDQIEYRWNYYEQYGSDNHPYDINTLIDYA